MMMRNLFRRPWRGVLLLWLGWYLALNGFGYLTWARLRLELPDSGYTWTANLTQTRPDGPSEGARFFARWDSGRYIQIARQGYADPSLSPYFPGYPMLMRMTDTLLSPFVAAEPGGGRLALAGVIVSVGMSLLAALGMFAFVKERLGEESALRGAFYLLIFPTAIFMTQIYTESTYLAASLWALVFIYRRNWRAALPLVVFATLTRPVGLFLIFPMAAIWLDGWWRGRTLPKKTLAVVIAPALVFWLFNVYLAHLNVDTITAQQDYGRYLLRPFALLALAQQIGWMGMDAMGAATVGLDLAMTLLGTGLCLIEWKRHPGLALYGLAAIWISPATGQLVSQNRYLLAAVPVVLVLTRWGDDPVVDRVWSLISILLLGLHTILFVQGYWAG